MLPHIVLASQSPRRRELLHMLGINDFEVIPSDSEEAFPLDLAPGTAAEMVALDKAFNVASKAPPDSLILAADTVVSLDGGILGKPTSEAEAEVMLRALSGRSHTVYSGVALLYSGRELKGYEATDVCFRRLGEDEIHRYIATGEPMDKAGAYGAQGLASIFIERIDGDFFNVVGLPLGLLNSMISKLGFEII